MRRLFLLSFMTSLWLSSAAVPVCASESFEAMILSARSLMIGADKDLAAAYTAAEAARGMAADPGQQFTAAMLAGRIAEQSRDFDAAKSAYAAAAATGGLDAPRLAEALAAEAAIWRRERGFSSAIARYQQALALPGLDAHHTQANLRLNLAAALEGERRWEDARHTFQHVLATGNIAPSVAFSALCGISRTFHREGNLTGMKPAVEAVLGAPGSDAQKNNLWRDYALLATAQNAIPEALAAWGRLRGLAGLSAGGYAESVERSMVLLADGGPIEDLKLLAAASATDENLPVADRLVATLVERGLKDGPDGKPVMTMALEHVGAAAAGMDPAARVAAVHRAGKLFMRLRRYPVVHMLLAEVAAMHQQLPPKVYACHYLDNAPRSVDAWLRSPWRQDPARIESRFEPYDQAAARLLVNDVNTGREAILDRDDAPGGDTSFSMAWDAAGWHIFIQCHDPAAAMVAAGLERGGQLELFFRPGQETAYYQWFISFPEALPQVVEWDSPHTAYRPMDDYYKVSTAVLEDGFGATVFIPWVMVYDKLPCTGERWPFGLMRWSRLGRTTWGGKVHEIHAFGRIEWQGLDAARLAMIKRQIVINAWGRYRAARTDIVNFWKDEQKGDRVFFSDVLLPFVEKLDADGKKVETAMTDAAVQELFREAVPSWMEFPHRVAGLRRQYLQAALLH